MVPCLGCHRHIRFDTRACPFCATPLREDAAPPSRFAGVLLGLTLFGCGVESDGDTGDTVANYDGGTSTTVGEDASITDVNSAGCMTYAGPGCSYTDAEGGSFTEDTGAPSSSTSDHSTTSEENSGSSGSSGAATGDSTGSTGGDTSTGTGASEDGGSAETANFDVG